MNLDAKLINVTLGANIFNENIETHLEINKIPNKEIKRLMIDDLICLKTKQQTLRLRNLVKEILNDKTTT